MQSLELSVYWVQTLHTGMSRLWVYKPSVDDSTQRLLNALSLGNAPDAETADMLGWDLEMPLDAVERLSLRLFS